MAITPDERFVYVQLSFLHGFVEFDLRTGRPSRIAILPLSDASRNVPRTGYLLDSAHHGLAHQPLGTKLCAAGTMSNYAAIVDRRTLRVDNVVRVGRVAVLVDLHRGRPPLLRVGRRRRPRVGDLVPHRRGRSRASRVGDHPQRMRPGTVRKGIL